MQDMRLIKVWGWRGRRKEAWRKGSGRTSCSRSCRAPRAGAGRASHRRRPWLRALWLDRRAWIGVLDGSVRARRDEEEETARQLRAAPPDDSCPLSCPLTRARCVGVGLPQWTSLYVSTVDDAAVESSLPFHCDCGPTVQYKLLILAYKLIN